MSTGENIKRIRKEKGLTQKELSKSSGVHEVQIARYENDKTKPSIGVLRKLAYALDTYISALIDDCSSYSEEIEADWSQLDVLSDDFNQWQEKEYYKELNNRGIRLMYELIREIFQRYGKYPVNLNDIDGLNIFLNKKLTEYKTLSNEELKAIEKDVLNYLDFLLDKALKEKEVIER